MMSAMWQKRIYVQKAWYAIGLQGPHPLRLYIKAEQRIAWMPVAFFEHVHACVFLQDFCQGTGRG